MAKYLSIRDGGKTNEEGATRLFAKLAGNQNKGRVLPGDCLVEENGTPDMSVNVNVGDMIIPHNDYFFHIWLDDIENVAISPSDPSNPRKDRLVAYVDLSVTDDTDSNNPGAWDFAVVEGTPAGSPTLPDDSDVETAIGAGNPFIDLYEINVLASATTILDANLVDRRSLFNLGGGVGGAEFGIPGDLAVVNDATPWWLAPKDGTFTSILARVKEAPTGANLVIRINKNGSQLDTITINAGSTNAIKTGLSYSFSQGDYFSIDITQIGSTLAGSSLTVALG